jgi:hypothetical protein
MRFLGDGVSYLFCQGRLGSGNVLTSASWEAGTQSSASGTRLIYPTLSQALLPGAWEILTGHGSTLRGLFLPQAAMPYLAHLNISSCGRAGSRICQSDKKPRSVGCQSSRQLSSCALCPTAATLIWASLHLVHLALAALHPRLISRRRLSFSSTLYPFVFLPSPGEKKPFIPLF